MYVCNGINSEGIPVCKMSRICLDLLGVVGFPRICLDLLGFAWICLDLLGFGGYGLGFASIC